MKSRMLARRQTKIAAYDEYRIGVLTAALDNLRLTKQHLEAINTDGSIFDVVMTANTLVEQMNQTIFKFQQPTVIPSQVPTI